MKIKIIIETERLLGGNWYTTIKTPMKFWPWQNDFHSSAEWAETEDESVVKAIKRFISSYPAEKFVRKKMLDLITGKLSND